MRRMVEKILRCYGQEILIPRLGITVLGFLQPVRGKGENLVLKEIGPVGLVQPGRYVFIGPAEPVLEEDEVLEVDGKCYAVRALEQICGIGGAVYQWGMCIRKGGAEAWGSSG